MAALRSNFRPEASTASHAGPRYLVAARLVFIAVFCCPKTQHLQISKSTLHGCVLHPERQKDPATTPSPEASVFGALLCRRVVLTIRQLRHSRTTSYFRIAGKLGFPLTSQKVPVSRPRQRTVIGAVLPHLSTCSLATTSSDNSSVVWAYEYSAQHMQHRMLPRSVWKPVSSIVDVEGYIGLFLGIVYLCHQPDFDTFLPCTMSGREPR